MSTTISVTDVPSSLVERFGDKISFSDIQGLYRDGMDRCQYDEVLPGKKDAESYAAHFTKAGKVRTSGRYVSLNALKKQLGPTR